VVFSASVSEEVEGRVAARANRVRSWDWKSGDRQWMVEATALFGCGEDMVWEFKAKVFPGRWDRSGISSAAAVGIIACSASAPCTVECHDWTDQLVVRH